LGKTGGLCATGTHRKEQKRTEKEHIRDIKQGRKEEGRAPLFASSSQITEREGHTLRLVIPINNRKNGQHSAPRYHLFLPKNGDRTCLVVNLKKGERTALCASWSRTEPRERR